MRLVIVHPYAVHAAAVGGVSRVFAFAKHMARRHRVSVYAHASDQPEVDARAILELNSLGIDQHIFRRHPCGILQKAAWWMHDAPYYVNRNRNPDLQAALQALDRRERIDVIHLELGYLAPLLEPIEARTVRVLAEQETMSLAIERLKGVPFAQKSWYECAAMTTAAKVKRFEASTLPRFDQLYGITAREAARLSEMAGREVGILPHVVDVERFRPRGPERSTRSVLFVGNFRHHPNLHALRWFIAEVWAKADHLRRKASLDVVGPNLPDDACRLVTAVGGRAHGYVHDLAARYADATVVVNPIRSGGGMRGKILEAFASARPVVTTPMGVEGVDAVSGRHCLIAADPYQFAAHLEAYLSEPALRRAHGEEARLLVQRYDARSVFSHVERVMEAEVTARRESLGQRKAV